MNHYRERIPISTTVEGQILREIKAICKAERYTFTEMIDMLFRQEINRYSKEGIRILEYA